LSFERFCSPVVLSMLFCGNLFASTPFVTSSDRFRSQLGIVENPALSDEASAVWVNPAGLGVRNSATTFSSVAMRNNPWYVNLLFAGNGSGFGWQRTDVGSGQRIDRWRFAGSGGSSPYGLSFGAAVELSDPDGLNESLFWSGDLGVLARPVSWMSAGLVVRQLGARRGYPWSVESGLALRPFGPHMSVFGGLAYCEDDPSSNPSHWHAGALANVGPGLEMYGAVNQNRTVLAGVQMILGRGSIGGAGSRASGGSLGSGWVIARSHADYRSNRLAMKGRIAEIRLKGEIRDQTPGFTLFGKRGTTLSELVMQINRAAQARDVGGLYLRFDNLAIGQGMAEELRDALIKFKTNSGKPIVAYLPEASFREYFIASVADSIFLESVGDLRLTGYGVGQLYFRRALDKLGVEADFTRIGRYKSAAETFTDSTMSDATREQYGELLDDWYRRTVDGIATSRGLSVDSVTTLVNNAPYMAAEAVRVGLIDSAGHSDRAYESVETMVRSREGRVSGKINLAHRRLFDETWGPRPKLAVIFASGEIVNGTSGEDFFSGTQMMGAETIAKALKQAREDDAIKAVVFRIDSPGGLALGSDMIWREVQLLWETDKPVVVSVGDLAASGGYYIACRADTIISNPGAVVGSIGVFDGKMVVERLARRLGIDVELLTRGDNAAINSSLASRTPEQRRRVAENVREVYDVFVNRVAAGRGMEAASVDSIGQGRIYTAANAVSIGLVDKLGGLDEAIRTAARMARLRGEVELVTMPKRSNVLETVIQSSLQDAMGVSIRQSLAGEVYFFDPVAASLR